MSSHLKMSRARERNSAELVRLGGSLLQGAMNAARARGAEVERLTAENMELNDQVARLLAELDAMQGVRPEIPPTQSSDGSLQRFGLRWNGPNDPCSVPMHDGYWTPWHLAHLTIGDLQHRENVLSDALKLANEGRDSALIQIIELHDKVKRLTEESDARASAVGDFRRQLKEKLDEPIL